MKVSIFSKAVIPTAFFMLACAGPGTDKTENHDHASHTGEHAGAAAKDTTAISSGQGVSFANLRDGDVVSSPVTVKFAVEGMQVLTIDSGVRPNTGHHHLLIDTLNFVPAGEMVPMGVDNIRHFGKGQNETKVELKPGRHRLSLQFADGVHRSYGIRMSRTVEITVK